MQSIPIAPAPSTSARPGRHGWRPPTARTWRSARAQIDAGSASTPTPAERLGHGDEVLGGHDRELGGEAVQPRDPVLGVVAGLARVRRTLRARVQCPHERRTVAVTRSPRAKPWPPASTRPSSSWPRISRSSPAGAIPNQPSEISRSVPQTPTSTGRTSTCVPSGRGSGIAATAVEPATPGRRTSACISRARPAPRRRRRSRRRRGSGRARRPPGRRPAAPSRPAARRARRRGRRRRARPRRCRS